MVSSTVNTFFGMIGIHHGGYAGLQQKGGGRRNLIFRWLDGDKKDDDDDDEVQLVWYNEERGVTVQKFDVDGKGWEALIDYKWKLNLFYTMDVEAKLKNGVWNVKHKFHGDGDSFYVAEFSRKTPVFGDATKFHTWIQDFGSEGCNVKRKALFLYPHAVINGQSLRIKKLTFTHGEGDVRPDGPEVWTVFAPLGMVLV